VTAPARVIRILAWRPEAPGWNLDREDGLSWQDAGLCGQTDPEAFFPEKGGSTREAKQVCRSCEVRAECLEYALEAGEPWGVWGGKSPEERREMIAARERQRNGAAA
jgi:WhiB family transcriptional regulator, redox-sensing transcriptional regulator